MHDCVLCRECVNLFFFFLQNKTKQNKEQKPLQTFVYIFLCQVQDFTRRNFSWCWGQHKFQYKYLQSLQNDIIFKIIYKLKYDDITNDAIITVRKTVKRNLNFQKGNFTREGKKIDTM